MVTGSGFGTVLATELMVHLSATSGEMRFKSLAMTHRSSQLYAGNLSTLTPDDYLLGGSYYQIRSQTSILRAIWLVCYSATLYKNQHQQRIETVHMKKIEIIIATPKVAICS